MAVKFQEIFNRSSFESGRRFRLVGQEASGDAIFSCFSQAEDGTESTDILIVNPERHAEKKLFQIPGKHNVVQASVSSTETLLAFTTVTSVEPLSSTRSDPTSMYETCLVVLQPKSKVRIL